MHAVPRRARVCCRCHYAWTVAAVIFGTIVVAGGVRSTPALVINPLESEFGWSRALISGAVSVNIALYGASGPFAAALMDTFGMRACILVALALMFCGIALATAMSAAWHLYVLWGVLVGLACGVIAPVLGKVVVNRWFVSHGGLMMGAFSAAAQTGQVILAPLLGWIVEAVGWRGVAWTMAAVAGAAALPVLCLLRERPADVGLTALGAEAPLPAADGSGVEVARDAKAAIVDLDVSQCLNDSNDVSPQRPAAVVIELVKGVPEAADAVPPTQQPAASAPSVAAVEPIEPLSAAPEPGDPLLGSGESSALTPGGTPIALPGREQTQPHRHSEPVAPRALPAPESATATDVSPFLRPFVVLSEVASHVDFWLLAGSFFVCGASTNGLIAVHLIPACVDSGMPEVQAAGFLGGIGAFDIVGTVASGALTDRADSRTLLAAYYAFRGAALVFLPWALRLQLAGMWPFAVLYGLDWVATVPPTAALCTACFGPRRSAIAFAWCLCAHQLGAAAIAAVAGVLRTQLGSYEWAFWSSGVLCVVTAAAVLCIQCGTVPLRLWTPRPAPVVQPAARADAAGGAERGGGSSLSGGGDTAACTAETCAESQT